MESFIIGIAGGTGSGKTTLTKRLKERFGDDVSVISHDNYYKRHCCFSKRMRKVFRKNEKSMLQNCNKKAKRKGRLQRVKKPM